METELYWKNKYFELFGKYKSEINNLNNEIDYLRNNIEILNLKLNDANKREKRSKINLKRYKEIIKNINNKKYDSYNFYNIVKKNISLSNIKLKNSLLENKIISENVSIKTHNNNKFGSSKNSLSNFNDFNVTYKDNNVMIKDEYKLKNDNFKQNKNTYYPDYFINFIKNDSKNGTLSKNPNFNKLNISSKMSLNKRLLKLKRKFNESLTKNSISNNYIEIN